MVAERIIEMMRDTNMPNGISGVGFGMDDVKALADSSIRQTRAINNAPRVADLSDMEGIYRDAVSYW